MNLPQTVSAHSSFLTLQACYCSQVHHIYVFKEHCFPCGRPVKYEGRTRGYDVILVCTKDYEDKIQQVCKVRNDECAETVRGRLEFVQDLHAADAVYHHACSVNFQTRKQIPKKYGNDTDSKPAKGRPTNKVKSKLCLEETEVLVENDKEQFTISDLVRKMQEYLEGTGATPVRCCIYEGKVTVTLWRENSDHNCE